MKIISKVNTKESILWKKRIIDYKISIKSETALFWIAHYQGRIEEKKWIKTVYTNWFVFDWKIFWNNYVKNIIDNCRKKDPENYKKFKI